MAQDTPSTEELNEVMRACAHFADLAAAGAALSLWLTMWEREGREWLKTEEGVQRAWKEVTGLECELSSSQGFFHISVEDRYPQPIIFFLESTACARWQSGQRSC